MLSSARRIIEIAALILALLTAAMALDAWLASRGEQARLASTLAAQSQILAAATARETARQSALNDTLAQIEALKRANLAPQQMLDALTQYLSLPQPMTLAGASPPAGGQSEQGTGSSANAAAAMAGGQRRSSAAGASNAGVSKAGVSNAGDQAGDQPGQVPLPAGYVQRARAKASRAATAMRDGADAALRRLQVAAGKGGERASSDASADQVATAEPGTAPRATANAPSPIGAAESTKASGGSSGTNASASRATGAGQSPRVAVEAARGTAEATTPSAVQAGRSSVAAPDRREAEAARAAAAPAHAATEADTPNLPTAPTAQIPVADLKPLYDYVQTCRECQAKLASAAQDKLDDAAKIASLERERDAAITASKGGTLMRRLRHNLLWFAAGAASALASHAP